MRKHSGINKKTGRLKKGYKYSGKKLKSGLPQIVKVQKGGTLEFKPKGDSENKYANCQKHGCKTSQMPFCCPTYTPASGFCRINHDGCYKTGIQKTIRKRNLSVSELANLRKKMPKVERKDIFLIEELNPKDVEKVKLPSIQKLDNLPSYKELQEKMEKIQKKTIVKPASKIRSPYISPYKYKSSKLSSLPKSIQRPSSAVRNIKFNKDFTDLLNEMRTKSSKGTRINSFRSQK